MPDGIIQRLEGKLGLTPLSKLADSLDKFPDVRQLRLIKEVLETAERVSKSVPDLDKMVALVVEINSMPMDKLAKLEKILTKIESIIRKAPDQLVEFLASLKEE